MEKCGITPHCLYPDLLTLNVRLGSECASVKKKNNVRLNWRPEKKYKTIFGHFSSSCLF